MLHHYTKFGYRRFSSWGDIVQMNIHWNSELFCDFDLDHNRANQSFHKTIHLMMICHQTKFSCKKISSSADMVETVTFDQTSPHCDPELQDRKPIFLHDTLVHDVTSPYQVWLQKGWAVEEILSKWTFTGILKLSVTLTLTTTEQSNLFTQDNPPYDDVPSNQVYLEKDQQFR